MATVEKQAAGFKFGKYKTRPLREHGSVAHNGKTYKVLGVETSDGNRYVSIRLYNTATGRFIKQLLIDPNVTATLSALLKDSWRSVA